MSWPNPTPEKVFFLKVGDSSGSGGITAASTKEDSDDSLHIYDADKEMENSESFPVKDERDLAFSDSQLRQNRNIGECYIDQGRIEVQF